TSWPGSGPSSRSPGACPPSPPWATPFWPWGPSAWSRSPWPCSPCGAGSPAPDRADGTDGPLSVAAITDLPSSRSASPQKLANEISLVVWYLPLSASILGEGPRPRRGHEPGGEVP